MPQGEGQKSCLATGARETTKLATTSVTFLSLSLFLSLCLWFALQNYGSCNVPENVVALSASCS